MPERKPLRLAGFDYSSGGAYFITLCVKERACLLGSVAAGDGVLDVPRVRLSPYGEIAERQFLAMAHFYAQVTGEEYIVMPNHVHFILRISAGTSGTPSPTNAAGTSGTPSPTNAAGTSGTPSPTNAAGALRPSPANAVVPAFVSTWKRFVSRQAGVSLFQRSYYDHIIRSEADYRRIADYIGTNPTRWREDRFYPG